MSTSSEAKAPPQTSTPKAGWRFRIGVGLFVLGFACPVLLPLVAMTDFSPAVKAGLSAALLLGIPELMMLVAAAVMGKEGFQYIKSRLWGTLKKGLPPEQVGRWRYYFGLALFSITVLYGWVSPYAYSVIPSLSDYRILLGLAGDLVLLASLYLLGGEFWDKLRALFIHGAKVTRPEKT